MEEKKTSTKNELDLLIGRIDKEEIKEKIKELEKTLPPSLRKELAEKFEQIKPILLLEGLLLTIALASQSGRVVQLLLEHI